MLENVGTKRKKKTRKTNNATRGKISGVIGERGKTKNISREDKTIRTKLNIPKHRQIFYHQVRC